MSSDVFACCVTQEASVGSTSIRGSRAGDHKGPPIHSSPLSPLQEPSLYGNRISLARMERRRIQRLCDRSLI